MESAGCKVVVYRKAGQAPRQDATPLGRRVTGPPGNRRCPGQPAACPFLSELESRLFIRLSFFTKTRERIVKEVKERHLRADGTKVSWALPHQSWPGKATPPSGPREAEPESRPT